MGDETKQVRVDNWGIFFLQRLQMFFSKTDYCDMTLQFEGNVQLKVHRLVMNACTEYFQYLEQHCTVEDNVILMPEDLQADVIVPIVNFMYTGVLEFHLGIFDKLYKTARVMNITILTKLLDAQKIPGRTFNKGKRATSTPKHSSHHNAQPPPELPATLPGRKLPVWKRKNAPHQAVSSGGGAMGTSGLLFANNSSSSSGRSSSLSHNSDPLLVTTTADNTPKPTRFEWPDDDLPPMPLMETSFEDISYTSKPLLTKEEELRGSAAAAAFDDIRHTPNAGNRGTGKRNTSLSDVDMNDMTDYVKEQRIRVEMAEVAAETGLEHVLDGYNSASDLVPSGVLKRKAAGDAKNKNPQKKVRFDDSDNKSTTISVTTDASAGELDHNKIVAEILKKYPNLMKKNKNIKLKILTKNKSGATEHTRVENIQIRAPKPKGHQAMQGSDSVKSNFRSPPILKHHQQQQQQGSVPPGTRLGATTESNTNKNASTTLGPWTCDLCTSENNAATPLEFNLYYLYRKHMTDVHDQKFDPQLCRYCGQRCPKNNLMMYHLHTKHGIRPPPEYVFPKCSQCPYIALSQNVLNRHQLRHNQHEIQCLDCKLAFTSKHTLTSHIQITGHHTGARRNPKDRFDCQYCTKKYTSGENLFSHVKMQHRNEAIRDGIVSIDEPDEVDEIIEQEQQELQEQQMVEDFVHEELEPQEEYILPEIISEPELPHHQQQRQQQQPPKKVNILSNVKVMQQPKQLQQQQHKQMLLKRQQQQQQQQDVQSAITLEPSSEAEALNNVATGIATSLGLVDIVVLNDNQQLFLQSDSHDHHRTLVGQLQGAGDDQHQPEFILPELSSTATVTAAAAAATTTTTVSSSDHEVITTSADGSVIARSMLTGEDIGSTDELVMVLTDHDYGDNQEEISADNSNIVVLYSHPVGDGQQEQFLTSQGGNIMVNSETGMIEIRNGTETTSTTATTAGETTEDDEEQQQIELNPPSEHQQPEDENDHPIESIEMIQKEIESHNNDGDPAESKPNVAEIDGLAGKDGVAEVAHQQREEGDEEGITAEGVTNEGYSLNSTADSEQLSGQIDDLVENMDVSNAAEETSTEADHQEREKPQDETTSDGTIAQEGESSEEQQHEQIAGDLPQLQEDQCSSEINTSSQSDAVTENGGEEVSISKGSEETSQDEILHEEQDGNATLGLNDPDEELSGVPPEEHFADMTENAELSTEDDATAAPATDPLSEEPLPETDAEPRNETEQQTSQPYDAAQVELPPTETNKGEATAAAENQEANTTIEETPDNNALDQDGQEETVEEQPEVSTSLPPPQEESVEKQQTESADPVDLDESSRLSYTMDVVEEEQDATAAAAAAAAATSSENDSIKTDQQRDSKSQEQSSATVGAGTRNDTSTCPMDVEEEQEEVDTGSQSSQEDDEEEEEEENAAGNEKRRTTCKRKNDKSNPEKEINHLTKKSILDDWDDTDSQQSSDQQQKEKGEATTTDADDAKATAAAAAPRETVNKLMDDWEEEEDEDETTRKDTD